MTKSRILIVDDEPDIAEVLGDRLESCGYEVQLAYNARAQEGFVRVAPACCRQACLAADRRDFSVKVVVWRQADAREGVNPLVTPTKPGQGG